MHVCGIQSREAALKRGICQDRNWDEAIGLDAILTTFSIPAAFDGVNLSGLLGIKTAIVPVDPAVCFFRQTTDISC